jgi:uncharacterized membrane protein YsdA (DUF1294 family)
MKEIIHNIYKFYLSVALFLLASIGIALWRYTSIHPLWIYFITITMITFCFYGYDKHQAIHQKIRIPEVVLHILALAGGSAGALAGQYIFHHKTKKLKFQIVFLLIAAAQIGLIIWWVRAK